MSITTPVTQLLHIQHPILLAGMGQTSGAPLAAAVSNAGNTYWFPELFKDRRYTPRTNVVRFLGGLGVIGGVGYTPQMLKEMIDELKVSLYAYHGWLRSCIVQGL